MRFSIARRARSSAPPVLRPAPVLRAAPAARLGAAAFLLLLLLTAARSPVMPLWLGTLAAAVLVLAAWRPALVLPWIVAAAPFGEVAAAVPVRAAETLIVAFFAGWLLRVHPPIANRGRVPRTVLVPGLAFSAVAVLSWLVLIAERSAGLGVIPSLRQFVPMLGYLVTAGWEPPTAAMLHLLLMVAICLAVPALPAGGAVLGRRIAIAVAASGAVAAAASLGIIALEFVRTPDVSVIAQHFDLRVWRSSAHLADVNAAGSQYALAALTALGLAAAGGRVPRLWGAGLLLAATGLWLSGSRIALFALLCGVAAFLVLVWHRAAPGPVRHRRSARRPMIAGAAACAALALLPVWMSLPAEGEDADRGLDLRMGFLVTSGRMLALAPVSGVGVGTYYERSASFMPQSVLDVYPGGENAHNYFAQIAVELGLAGAVLFVWWLGAILRAHWQQARAPAATAPLAAGLLVGCGAYLVTCLTGHPLLVIGATVPFCAAAGAGLALANTRGPHEA